MKCCVYHASLNLSNVTAVVTTYNYREVNRRASRIYIPDGSSNPLKEDETELSSENNSDYISEVLSKLNEKYPDGHRRCHSPLNRPHIYLETGKHSHCIYFDPSILV
jgi:hypothetical protein